MTMDNDTTIRDRLSNSLRRDQWMIILRTYRHMQPLGFIFAFCDISPMIILSPKSGGLVGLEDERRNTVLL